MKRPKRVSAIFSPPIRMDLQLSKDCSLMAATRYIRLPVRTGKAFVPDFTVFINENGQHRIPIFLNNDTITARVRIEKRDAETGRDHPDCRVQAFGLKI